MDPDFQYGMIRKIIFMAVILIIMSLSFLTIVYYLYGDVQLSLFQPDPFSNSEGVDSLAGQRSLIDILWPVMSGCLLVAVFITLILGVLTTHHMAGPVFRMRRILGQIADGDLQGTDQLRKNDEFKSLLASINDLRAQWRERVNEMQTLCQSDEIKDSEALVQELKKKLDKFKT